MLKFLEKAILEVFSFFMLKTLGQIILVIAGGGLTLYLAELTPIVQYYNPLAYWIVFLISFLLLISIILIIRELLNYERAETFIEYEFKNNNLIELHENNIKIDFILRDGNIFHIKIVFNKTIKKPHLRLTDESGVSFRLNQCMPGADYASLQMTETTGSKHGRFKIVFNK